MNISERDPNQNMALIAEVGNNHEGSIALAEEMIETAFAGGAGAVKLRTFVPELYVSSSQVDRLNMLRFHLDPAIPSGVASAIKSEWARNLALGRRGMRYRIVRDAGGVISFPGVAEGRGSQRILSVDLISVSPESQGSGVRTALVRDFQDRAQTDGIPAQVGTQAANTSPVRFYERLGLTLTSAKSAMHAHALTEVLS
jgi:GNAT superfamily N-acetyltransferase